VWRAFDTATDRIVALKVLPAHLADDDLFKERFRREARAAAGLYEPHVVPIHSYGEIDSRLYVDMRLIVGRDLQSMLSEGPLDPGRAVTIMEQVASALLAAHQIGLVHRDVKPSNILVADSDFAYLIDFGIARGRADWTDKHRQHHRHLGLYGPGTVRHG
jgi:serine/threonine protein kinase